jgi:hypothetical protein
MKITKSKRIGIVTAIMLFAMCFVSAGQDSPKLDVTAGELYKTAINNPGFQKSPDGEGFCWQARGAMRWSINDGYREFPVAFN